MIKISRNPDVYHGNNNMTNYFEGWYFKLVQADTGHTYCFIPGVYFSDEDKNSHSFIQVIKGNDNSFQYLRFDIDDFKASTSDFKLRVGKNTFSRNKINLNINRQNEKISGTLFFDRAIKWPDSMVNPGSMGFYNYLGFMQCYSQVCAIDGNICGSLSINGETVDFTKGKVYIEKNWGKAFPYSYLWLQGNNFQKENASVTCSIAHIPFPIKSFTGFLIGFYAGGCFYKFTSMNRSSLSVQSGVNTLIIKTNNRDYCLKIKASYPPDTFLDLYAPRGGNMIPVARETLKGTLYVTLKDRKSGCIIFQDICSSAGVELSNIR